MTINELMICSLSLTLKKWFVELGDTTSDRVRLAIPVNVRWSNLEKFDDVKAENKFSSMPIQIDLCEDP